MIVATVFLSAPVRADGDSDHERARMALESGNIVPLALILERVESLYEGKIIEVELEGEDDDGDPDAIGGYIYEIKLLTPQGNVLKLEMDASTLELLRVKGYGAERAIKEQSQ
ncbi:MAG: PepSY domain-containing protein [Rhodospirillaceae bacterium]|nr:PepSY domain-containing protein [Rhodospirillaceae bacterium]